MEVKILSLTKDFKAGDIVRFRTWDDMKKEFGLRDGYIDCKFAFIREMKYLCGKEFEITKVGKNGHVYGHDCRFDISTDMIEHVRLQDVIGVENSGGYLL